MSPTTTTAPTIPDYLDNKIFKRCLENGLNLDGLQVIDTKLIVASKPGENYTSTIIAATIIYKTADSKSPQTAHLVIKNIHTSIQNEIKTKADMVNVIYKEIKVYRELLPKLNKIITDTEFSPKCYDILEEPGLNLVFDNMKMLGYDLADREVGLDEIHMGIVLKKIAKFHAASIKLLRQEPSIEENFKTGFFVKQSVDNPIFQHVFRENFKLGAEMVAEMQGYEHFEAKLMKMYDHFISIALDAVSFDETNDIKMLNHGDLWVNNFLYKYDKETKKPTDVIFVDYQGTYFTSPGIDLNYLFATSATLETMKRKQDLIATYYYLSLVKTLKELKVGPIPSLDDILNEVQKREVYTLMCLFGILPLVSMDREESKDNDFTQFLDEEKSSKKRLVGMSSKRFIESMKYTLSQLENIIDKTISKY